MSHWFGCCDKLGAALASHAAAATVYAVDTSVEMVAVASVSANPWRQEAPGVAKDDVKYERVSNPANDSKFEM